METSKNRYLSVMFADDIREEVGGKLSIMGIYQGKMFVPEFPTVLPKLAVLMTAGTRSDNPFGKATFRLFKNEEIIFEFDIPGDGLLNAQEENEQVGEFSLLEIQVAKIIPCFSLETACKLSAKLETETEEIESKTLEINIAPRF